MDEEIPEMQALVDRAFPTGLSAQERSMLYALPAERREKVRRRLAAMVAADTATTTAEMDRIAAEAGLKRSALFRLRQRWRDEGRSLEVIVPWATRRGSRESRGMAVDKTVKAARRRLKQDASMSNGKIARLLIAKDKVTLSLPTVVKVVQQCRAQAAFNPSVLALAYGSSVIVDVCAIDMLVGEGDELSVPICVFVVERITNLILAARLTEPSRALDEQFAACNAATRYLAETSTDRELPGDSRITRVLITLAPSDDTHKTDKLVEALEDLGSQVDVTHTGKRRFGERLRSSMGPTFGKLRLLADWPETREVGAVRRSGRLLNLIEARQLLEGQVQKHNSTVLARLEGLALFKEQRASNGAMSRALGRVLAASSH